jgi:cytochrome c-type biogenesis protein CcmH
MMDKFTQSLFKGAKHASPLPSEIAGRSRLRPYRNTRHFLSAAVFVCFGILLLAALPALAQDSVPVSTVTDDAVNAIAGKLYCPVCENITLDTCGTAACADWRYEIRLQLEAGKTESQIIEDFVHRFGDRVVGTPIDPTLRALSLFTPWIVIALGLVTTALVLSRRRVQTAVVEITPSAAADHYQSLFEQDLANR